MILLSEKLKSRLIELHLSEAEACRIAGLKSHQIKTIRMGNMPRPMVLVRLSRALRIPAVELLYAAVEQEVPEWERIDAEHASASTSDLAGSDGYAVLLSVVERVLEIATEVDVTKGEVARCIALTYRRILSLERSVDEADIDLIATTVLDTLKAR